MKNGVIGLLSILAAIMLISCPVLAQVMIDYDGDGFDDRNGDDPDPYDPRVPDRDGDGIRDIEDRYPDDPYNRDTTEDTTRPDEDTDITTSAATNETDDGLTWGDNVCCFLNTPLFWIIIGSLVFCYGVINRNKWRPAYSLALMVVGVIMALYGFSLWGVGIVEGAIMFLGY